MFFFLFLVSCLLLLLYPSVVVVVVVGRDVKDKRTRTRVYVTIDRLVVFDERKMILHRLARTTTRHTLSLSVTVLLSWCSIGPVNSGSFPAEVCSSSPPPLYIYFPLSKLKKKKKTKLEKLETLADKYLRAPRHEEEERIKEFGAWLEIRSLERGTEFLFRPGKGL